MKSNPTPLTFSEFEVGIHSLCKLKLWFVWTWRKVRPSETIATALRRRVDIFRKTTINSPDYDQDSPPFDDIPEWIELEKTIAAHFENFENDVDAFRESAFKSCEPSLKEAMSTNWNNFRKEKNLKCGSLTYNHPSPESPETIAIHIANALTPKSIFDSPTYLPKCLVDLMNKTEAEFGSTSIHCGSWLNSHPRWLALFPEEYSASLSEPDDDIQWHLGFWGQFINARGGFNKKNAEKFRTSEEMPFAYRTGTCSFKALRKHLNTLFFNHEQTLTDSNKSIFDGPNLTAKRCR